MGLSDVYFVNEKGKRHKKQNQNTETKQVGTFF